MLGPVGRILERRRAEVVAACARRGAHRPRVFGSVARGEDGPESDIDLLVELEPGRTLLDLEQLEIELREILGIAVDVGTDDPPGRCSQPSPACRDPSLGLLALARGSARISAGRGVM
jgi:uncharacterized protein